MNVDQQAHQMPCRRLRAQEQCRPMVQGVNATGGGDHKVDENYWNGAAFLNEPTVIQGGIDNNDACIVGTTSDGVVVAFRGTW